MMKFIAAKYNKLGSHKRTKNFQSTTWMNLSLHLSAFSEVTFITHQRALKTTFKCSIMKYFERKLDISLENVMFVLGASHCMNVHSLKFTLKGICKSFHSKRTPFKYFGTDSTRTIVNYNTRQLKNL